MIEAVGFPDDEKLQKAVRGKKKKPRSKTLLAADPSDGSVGPSQLVSDYFAPRAATAVSPQRNLFTAQRCGLGSAYLPRRNNCCDDRLRWEHGQACGNKRSF